MTDRPDLDRLEALAAAATPPAVDGPTCPVCSRPLRTAILKGHDDRLYDDWRCADIARLTDERDRYKRMVEAVEAMCPTEEPQAGKSALYYIEGFRGWKYGKYEVRQAMHAAGTPAERDATDSEATEDGR